MATHTHAHTHARTHTHTHTHIYIPWGKTFSSVPKSRSSVKVKIISRSQFKKNWPVQGHLCFTNPILFPVGYFKEDLFGKKLNQEMTISFGTGCLLAQLFSKRCWCIGKAPEHLPIIVVLLNVIYFIISLVIEDTLNPDKLFNPLQTMPHFDVLKIHSCGKHCEKRRNCL